MARKQLTVQELTGEPTYQKFVSRVEKLQNSQKVAMKKIAKRFSIPKNLVRTWTYLHDFSNLSQEDQVKIAREVRRYGYYV